MFRTLVLLTSLSTPAQLMTTVRAQSNRTSPLTQHLQKNIHYLEPDPPTQIHKRLALPARRLLPKHPIQLRLPNLPGQSYLSLQTPQRLRPPSSPLNLPPPGPIPLQNHLLTPNRHRLKGPSHNPTLNLKDILPEVMRIAKNPDHKPEE